MCKHRMVHLCSDQMQKIWIVMSRLVKNAGANNQRARHGAKSGARWERQRERERHGVCANEIPKVVQK